MRQSAAPSHAPANEQATLLRASKVLEGDGVMQVTAVGNDTKIAALQKSLSIDYSESTPFGKQLGRIISVTSRAVLFMALISFLLFTVKGIMNVNFGTDKWWNDVFAILVNNFMMSNALIIITLPKGLPYLLSTCTALNSRHAERRNSGEKTASLRGT